MTVTPPRPAPPKTSKSVRLTSTKWAAVDQARVDLHLGKRKLSLTLDYLIDLGLEAHARRQEEERLRDIIAAREP